MASTVERHSVSASSSSPGRRILSRIASPFAAASPRAIVDFSISLDDELKQYGPGDIVSGSVTLRTNRSTRLTHIVVSLRGFVQVYKAPGTPGERARHGPPRGSWSAEPYGNGFAPLLEEEEIALCGDGTVNPGTLHFRFELQFPHRSLPSSIDFERGSISYLVTASLTRPTTILPVLTSERKLCYVERIDIAKLPQPRPRTITLEPIAKRSRHRYGKRRTADQVGQPGLKVDSARLSGDPLPTSRRTSSVQSSLGDGDVPRSPVPSSTSLESVSAFSASRSMQAESQYQQSLTGSESGTTSTTTSRTSRAITATVEAGTSGCLRGDSLTVKINVAHTKHIKSLYGVIATLYRQARVDMHPDSPVGPVEKGKATRHEDYLPKSLTGLGGLSLSGAGSSHVFRKDLSQVMMPLMVDPNTLTAEVTAKLRVPDDAFSTISNVPGGMISFHYYVETVLDIQGKLAGLDRGIGNMPDGLQEHASRMDVSDTMRAIAMPLNSTIVDTASIRRDKSVVACTFEVTVGTYDSDRRRGKQKLRDPVVAEPSDRSGLSTEWHPSQDQAQGGAVEDGDYEGDEWREDYDDPRWYSYEWSPDQPDGNGTEDRPGYWDDSNNPQRWQQNHPAHGAPPLAPVPIPVMPDESQMTEKQRVHAAEMRLLPSRPPEVDGAAEPLDNATAPYLPDDADGPVTAGASAPPLSTSFDAVPPSVQEAPEPDIPLYEAPLVTSSANATAAGLLAGDDKLELQRQRLLAEASAPPGEELDGSDPLSADVDRGEPAGHGPDGTSAFSNTLGAGAAAPSAPSAAEVEAAGVGQHDSHADAPGSSGLPRYER